MDGWLLVEKLRGGLFVEMLRAGLFDSGDGWISFWGMKKGECLQADNRLLVKMQA